MIRARKAKHLDVTTMFTQSQASTPLGQSERAYYLSYFINSGVTKVVSDKFESRCWGLKGRLARSRKVKRMPASEYTMFASETRTV